LRPARRGMRWAACTEAQGGGPNEARPLHECEPAVDNMCKSAGDPLVLHSRSNASAAVCNPKHAHADDAAAVAAYSRRLSSARDARAASATRAALICREEREGTLGRGGWSRMLDGVRGSAVLVWRCRGAGQASSETQTTQRHSHVSQSVVGTLRLWAACFIKKNRELSTWCNRSRDSANGSSSSSAEGAVKRAASTVTCDSRRRLWRRNQRQEEEKAGGGVRTGLQARFHGVCLADLGQLVT
jgi:hypothetical protein